jgi:hypothetical protein
MNFPVAVDESPPLESGDARDIRAPVIAAFEEFGNQVELAAAEVSRRKLLRDIDPNLVTAEEVKQSRRRLVAVETIEAQIAHGVGNVAVMGAIAALGNQVAAYANQVAALGDRMDALLRNQRAREKNRLGIWTPLVVERPGANPMGEFPDQPLTREAVVALTQVGVTALANRFNLPPEHFGLEGTNLPTRRDAVLTYFQEG